MLTTELISQINIKLAEFCFNNAKELIQFDISCPATATLLPSIVSYTIKEPVYGTDDYRSWYLRAIGASKIE